MLSARNSMLTKTTLRGLATPAMMLVLLTACGPIAASATPSPSVVPTPSSPFDGVVDVEAVADSYGAFEETGAPFGSLAHMQWLLFCVRAFGFAAEISMVPGANPGVYGKVTSAQRERWAMVDQLCSDEAVRRGWIQPQPMSREQRDAEYDRLVEVNECLTGIGYDTDPPSRDAFVDGAEWNVYANTPRGGPLGVAPSAGSNLPADVVAQLKIQEQCPAW